jgi:hypothetical protein
LHFFSEIARLVLFYGNYSSIPLLLKESMRQRGLLLLAFFAPLILVGCGPGHVAVEGSVTVDGAPLTTGNVSYHPVNNKDASDKVVGHGDIDAQGKYRLSTDGTPGVPPGTYKVVVRATPPPDAKNPYAVVPPLIDTKYSDLSTTPITVDVASGNSADKYNLAVTK